jgi:hypothetical protein
MENPMKLISGFEIREGGERCGGLSRESCGNPEAGYRVVQRAVRQENQEQRRRGDAIRSHTNDS